MANFQYKTSSDGAYADVSATAYYGTYSGTLEVKYPEANERDGLGRPCAAIGQPVIIMQSSLMTHDGVSFWEGLFATTTATYVELWLKVYNARDGLWTAYHGYLSRPKWNRMIIGNGNSTTYYYDVEISMQTVAQHV